ncbi:hypothetical protein ACFPIC_02855 [Arcanobacterium hippocoleae]
MSILLPATSAFATSQNSVLPADMQTSKSPIQYGGTLNAANNTQQQKNTKRNPDGVLFIGTAGIDFSDLDFTNPNLKENLANYSFAALSPRTVNPRTCAEEGWMSLRVNGDVFDRVSPPTPLNPNTVECNPVIFTEEPSILKDGDFTAPQKVHISEFSNHIANTKWQKESPFPADTVGVGRNAALPLANSDGEVNNWYPYPAVDIPRSNTVTQDRLIQILNHAQNNVLVDIGGVNGDSLLLNTAPRIAQIQNELSNVLRANERSKNPRRVVIASLGDRSRSAQLHFFATNSNLNQNSGSSNTSISTAPGVIYSVTTRATGFITIPNVREIIVGDYSEVEIISKNSLAEALQTIKDVEDHAYVVKTTTANWYQIFNLLAAIFIALTLILFFLRPAAAGKKWGAPRICWRILELGNTFVFAFVPAALILNFFPWWKLAVIPRFDTPEWANLFGIGFTIFLAGLLTGLAQFSKHPVGIIAAIAFLVLSSDIIAGSLHQRNGFMGSLVLTSRRYYGISNRTYLILIIAGLLATLPIIYQILGAKITSISKMTDKFAASNSDIRESASTAPARSRISPQQRKKIALIVVLIGLFTLAVDAMPSWGADFGGPPGIIASFGIAAILLAGLRLRWWHGLVWILLSVTIMGIVGFVDARGNANSHIGKFWQSLGSAESFALIGGKIRDVTRSFFGRPDLLWLIAVVIVITLLSIFAARKLNQLSGEHFATIREMISLPATIPLIIGITAGILIAVPINDSGAIMIKEGLYIGVPAIFALLTGTLARNREDESHMRHLFSKKHS